MLKLIKILFKNSVKRQTRKMKNKKIFFLKNIKISINKIKNLVKNRKIKIMK